MTVGTQLATITIDDINRFTDARPERYLNEAITSYLSPGWRGTIVELLSHHRLPDDFKLDFALSSGYMPGPVWAIISDTAVIFSSDSIFTKAITPVPLKQRYVIDYKPDAVIKMARQALMAELNKGVIAATAVLTLCTSIMIWVICVALTVKGYSTATQ